MKKILACVVVVAALALCGCASTQGSTGTASSAVASAASTASTASSTAAQFEIPHRYASASEGKDGNGYESPEIIEGVIAYLNH